MVSTATIDCLLVFLRDREIPIEIAFNHSAVLFVIDRLCFRATLHEGQFPATGALMPKESATKIVVERAELLKALEGAARFVVDSMDLQRDTVDLSASPDSLSMQLRLHNTGTFETRMQATASPVNLSISQKFLREAVSVTDSVQVAIDFETPALPIVVREHGYIAVIAPVRRPPES
jgi:DNA polymerase III subunit beta